jgi:5-methylcytosine-specific restriction endonuclease McrA
MARKDPEQIKQERKDYLAAHAERIREQRKQYRAANVANASRAKARSKQYAVDNPDKVRATQRRYWLANKERIQARVNRWVRQNVERVREKLAERNRRRRARKNGAVGFHTDSEWLAVVKRFKGRCVCCGVRPKLPKQLTRDHVVPLFRGGSDFISNIQPLCRRCNSAKGPHHSTDYRKMPFTGSGQQVLTG